MKLKKGSAAAKAYMAKIRAKRKVGAIAKTKTGKPKKRLNKAEREYNQDVDAYKYFIVWNNKVQSGWEFKNDALDALSDYDKGSAKIYTKTQLIKAGIFNPANDWKYLSGSVGYKSDRTKMLKTATVYMKKYKDKGYSRTEAIRQANIDASFVGSKLQISAKERRLGATPKDVRSNGYHKDNKSHNVNIRVISGFKNFVKYKGFVIDIINLSNGKKEYAVNMIKPISKKEVYLGSYASLAAAKKWINRVDYLTKQLDKK